MSALLPSVFAWTWETSLATVVLIGLVLLLQFALQKFLTPRWRYALWLLVVVRLLMPAVPSSRYSVFNWGILPRGSGPRASEPRLSEPPIPVAPPEAPVRPEGPALPLPSQGEEAHFQGSEGPLSYPWWLHVAASLLAAAPVLWLLGAVGYLLTVLAQHWRFSRCVNDEEPIASGRVISMIAETKTILALRKDVSAIQPDSLRAPSVFGFIKPLLLLSKAMLNGLSDDELRLVILHELVHVQRRDVLLNWLLILVQGLHWFNPLVWLALRRLRADRELVCDAAVMRHLSVKERHAYGTTLIKILESFSKTPLVPSLVPILSHKHEIHRRIIMIAQFKPTARLVTLASALLLLTLGYFTFTSAAERVAPPAVERPSGEASLEKQREASYGQLRILEEELAKHEVRLSQKQQDVDALRDTLQIADEGGHWQRFSLEGRRIEMQNEITKLDIVLSNLTTLSKADLKKAVVTLAPDHLLFELLSHEAVAEQNMAKLLETFGAAHPEVKATRALLKTINNQIDDRVDGLLIGFKTKRDSEKAALEKLQAEVEKTKKADMELAIKRRLQDQAKRDLENLQFMRERLAGQIIQEKIHAAIPK